AIHGHQRLGGPRLVPAQPLHQVCISIRGQSAAGVRHVGDGRLLTALLQHDILRFHLDLPLPPTPLRRYAPPYAPRVTPRLRAAASGWIRAGCGRPRWFAVSSPSSYWAGLPPSTRNDAPVMKDALSDERNTMVWATSSGAPTRLSGTVVIKPAFLSSVPVKRFSIPVSIGPGATALTRTPDPAASSAADLVNPSTACLLAA